MNKSAKEFKCDILGFPFLDMCFRHDGPFQELDNMFALTRV